MVYGVTAHSIIAKSAVLNFLAMITAKITELQLVGGVSGNGHQTRMLQCSDLQLMNSTRVTTGV